MSTQQDGELPSVDLIRVAAATGRDESTCPSSLRWKTRPRTRAVGRFPKEQLDGFVLRPVMAALDEVEFDQKAPGMAWPVRQDQVHTTHPGVVRFAEHATAQYLAAEELHVTGLRPVRELWVAQRVLPSVVWELYAWGRRYESANGEFREFRFVRLGVAHQRSPTEIAIAAYVAAFGQPSAWPEPWSEPFQPTWSAGVERVRVLDVGLVDGSVKLLFDGTAEEVEAYFADHGRRQISAIAMSEELVPGSACGGCKRVAVCDGPVRTPGLLNVKSGNGPLRTVSISSLRYYRNCPAQAYLRAVRLPRAYEYSAEAELGHAVHAWLEAAHKNDGHACSSDTLPTIEKELSAGIWRVTDELANTGASMLAHHIEICPFHERSDIDVAWVEPQLTFLDTVARAVVVAKPDLVYRQSGDWVWRELKTTQKPSRSHDDPLYEFPQLALGVAVLAAGALGPGGAGRVELEILRPTGAEIVLIDPTDEDRVETARSVLREWAAPWRSDHTFEAHPGRNCRWCPVSQWCPSYPGPGSEQKDDKTSAGSKTTSDG